MVVSWPETHFSVEITISFVISMRRTSNQLQRTERGRAHSSSTNEKYDGIVVPMGLKAGQQFLAQVWIHRHTHVQTQTDRQIGRQT